MICMTGGHGNSIARVADRADDVIKAVRGKRFVKLMATGGVLTPGVNPEDAHFMGRTPGAGTDGERRHGTD
jgi:hypothetical protein